MLVLTVVNSQNQVVCLDFLHWQLTGELVEVPGVTAPLFGTLLEVPGLRPVIGIPREMDFRIQAHGAGYQVLDI